MPCYNKKGRAILIGSSPWTKTLISIRKAALVYETTGGFSYVLADKQQYLPIISASYSRHEKNADTEFVITMEHGFSKQTQQYFIFTTKSPRKNILW